MKILRLCSIIIFITGVILITVLSQKIYAADTKAAGYSVDADAMKKIKAGIDADRDNIIRENKAINADRAMLKNAEKDADKTKVEQINQDIEKRKIVITDLKKEIKNKKRQKDALVYGTNRPGPNKRVKGD